MDQLIQYIENCKEELYFLINAEENRIVAEGKDEIMQTPKLKKLRRIYEYIQKAEDVASTI